MKIKKLLVLLFFLFFLFLPWTKVLAAQGVDCSSIDPPNLSGYVLTNNTVYEEKRLGTSQTYQRDLGDFLTYYSFDNGYDFIGQEVLDSHLVSAFQDIVQAYSTVREENYELQEDAKYLNMEIFNELGMQEFINQGVFVTSMGKNSEESIKKVEVVTVGTDGSCIHKVRWTAHMPLEAQLHEVLGYFVGLLDAFYKGLKFKGLYN